MPFDRVVALGQRLHSRYSRVFWTLHSIWALATGIAVLVLAHNRYGFLPWAVLFIALTWGSTLFFSRLALEGSSPVMRVARGVVSYLTRVMYQETLFFLIPFYFYSATFPSLNGIYVVVLCALAALSCFDIVFDRLLHDSRGFVLGFFAFVSFSALQLFLPLLLRTRVESAEWLAALLAFGAAAALAFRRRDLRSPRTLVVAAATLVAVAVSVWLLRPLIPPVPLRLTRVRFAAAVDPANLRTRGDFSGTIHSAALDRGRLYAVATVFSPARLPAQVRTRFTKDRKVLRSSRTVDLTVSTGGFRIWDSVRIGTGADAAGTYRLEVWTAEGQLVGRKELRVLP